MVLQLKGKLRLEKALKVKLRCFFIYLASFQYLQYNFDKKLGREILWILILKDK